MPGILDGVKVMDFGRAAVGPLSATYLGMMGASVIKIEPPEGDMVRRGAPTMKGMGTTFMGNNVGKRGIMLDLKKPEDHEIAVSLIAAADVAMDNFRSNQVMVQLGLGYDVISKINPRIIYLQSGAYGNTGPYVGMTSAEWYAQASGGYTSVNGARGGEPEFVRGTANMDWNAAMVNAQALLIALYVRERTGRGLHIETSQFESSIMAGITRFAEYIATGESPQPMGSARPNIVPDQAFETAMGWINVSVPHDAFWPKLCGALNRPDLLEDARFRTNDGRVREREALIPILAAEFRRQSADQWLRVLRAHDVPCGQYYTEKPLSHVLMGHPQVQANDLLTTIDTQWGPLNSVQPHWKFSDYTCAIQGPPPGLDEHRDAIVREWLGQRTSAAV